MAEIVSQEDVLPAAKERVAVSQVAARSRDAAATVRRIAVGQRSPR